MKVSSHNTILVALILFLGLISSSFLVKAENELPSENVCGNVSLLCEKAKNEFLQDENFVLRNKGCSLIDCYCDNSVYADALNLIMNNCYKKLEFSKKEK